MRTRNFALLLLSIALSAALPAIAQHNHDQHESHATTAAAVTT